MAWTLEKRVEVVEKIQLIRTFPRLSAKISGLEIITSRLHDETEHLKQYSMK
jgi:hypothetical protein